MIRRPQTIGVTVVRIVIIRLNSGDFGKIGTYNVQEIGLANALMKYGHEVDVLFTHKECSGIEKDGQYDFVYYLPHKSIGLHGIIDTELLSQFAPEKIILFSDNQLWAKNVIEWAGNHKVPVIHYFGNVLSDNPNWLHQLYTKLILMRNRRSYDHSINVAKTNKVKEEMEQLGVPCRGVIHVGLDDTILQKKTRPDLEIRHQFGYEDDETVILFVGRLVDYKKPLFACDILKEYMSGNRKAKLVVIGKGPLENELMNYIRECGLDSSVVYVGRVGYEQMYKYFVSSDCLINLSAQEIFGMTILEAMYYGLPVIAHTAPGPNDIIDDGMNGYLCESEDVREWCRLIEEAVNDPDRIGAEARLKIESSFLWDSIAKEFMAL